MKRTFWRHTAKAIKKVDAPADRIFAVVDIDEDGDLVAWKCTELPDGRLAHPGYAEPLDWDSELIWSMSCENGAEPTAIFKPDSFYRQAIAPTKGPSTYTPVRIIDPAESKIAMLSAALQHYACDCGPGLCEFGAEEGRESNPGCGRTAQVALRDLVR